MKQLRFGLFVLALAFLLLLPGIRSGQAQEGKWLLRYIVSGENALLFNRPELVCGGEVKQMQWSPDGNYAVVVRDAAPPFDPNRPTGPSTVSVAVWNNQINLARTVWSAPLNQYNASLTQGIAWLPKTDVCLLDVVDRVTNSAYASHFLMIMPLRDTVREIPTTDLMRFDANPTLPLAMLQGYHANGPRGDPHNSRFQVLHADGSLQDMQDYPQKNMVPMRWSPDGKFYYGAAQVSPDDSKPKFDYYALDVTAGAWSPLEKRPVTQFDAPAISDAPKSDLRIVRNSGVVELDGEKRTVHPAWLATTAKSGPPRSLIAADCEEAILSPKGDAVLYRTKEGAFVLPLTKIPVAPFTETLKKVAMSNAKQVGLGLMMYVQDYDEAFPLAEFNIGEVVNPYVKNSDVFEGFTYSCPAKSLASIANPAVTVMGTVAGPGGEAVIYADGHVTWRDKK